MRPRSCWLLTPLALSALLVSTRAGAQVLVPESPLGRVKANSGVTGTFAPGTPNAYGLGGVFEPHAVINDFLALGFRLEAAALGGLNATDVQNVHLDARLLGAAMAKAEVKLIPGDISPFAGLGVGWYAVIALSGGTSGTPTGYSGNGPGVMPQVGVDLGWFRIAMQVNWILGDLNPASYFALELAWRVY